MTSRREAVLDGVKVLIETALPFAKVCRNQPKPKRPDPGGNVIIRDGDPGEPSYYLSPLRYAYEHQIELEIAAFESMEHTSGEAVDQMMAAIGAQVMLDRTLGGLCDFIDTQAPATDELTAEGVDAGRWASTAIIAAYVTDNPLT